MPQAIFRATNDEQSQFLAGYFDADGAVNLRRGGSAEYYSISEKLIDGVQELLSRLGIWSIKSVKRGMYKGKRHLSWRLTIANKFSLYKFNGWVGKYIANDMKRKRIGEISVLSENYHDNTNVLPYESKKMIISKGKLLRDNGIRIDNKYMPSKTKMLKVAQFENNRELENRCQTDRDWEVFP